MFVIFWCNHLFKGWKEFNRTNKYIKCQNISQMVFCDTRQVFSSLDNSFMRINSTCLMRLKSSLNSKAFTTHITDERLLSGVSPHVISQPSWSGKLLWTHITLVWLVTTVGELVLHKVKWLNACKLTLVTLERLLTWNTNNGTVLG